MQGRSEEWGGVRAAAQLLEGDTAIEEGKGQVRRVGTDNCRWGGTEVTESTSKVCNT